MEVIHLVFQNRYQYFLILVPKNLKIGTDKNPVIIDEIAPVSSKLSQKIASIITGQNVAAIPDQPKITNQNNLNLPNNV